VSRCRWISDPKIGRWHLPGCMGAAVYGPNGCTCIQPSRRELEERIEALERRITQLEPAKP
jgi:hypothetical protein